MSVSVLVASYKRNDQLELALPTLVNQLSGMEVILLDELHSPDPVAKGIADKFGIRYVHSGKSKGGKATWRHPGFSFNIGAKLASHDNLILSCAEILHINETVPYILEALNANNNIMAITDGRMIREGSLQQMSLEKLKSSFNTIKPLLGTHLPFFMGIKTNIYREVRGYDESLKGPLFDDGSFVARMLAKGLIQVKTEGKIIHLPHPQTAKSETPLSGAANQKTLNDKNIIFARGRDTEILKRLDSTMTPDIRKVRVGGKFWYVPESQIMTNHSGKWGEL